MGHLFAFCLIFSAAPLAAEEVYESPTTFIANAFPGGSQAGSVTISGAAAESIRTILGRNYQSSRVRYWKSGNRTAWVLEHIGKFKPITTGIIVDGGKIDTVKVLIYREKIGWEVQRAAFTRQFRNASVRDDRRRTLSKRINGISGATLSVNALEKLSRVALVLHKEVSG